MVNLPLLKKTCLEILTNMPHRPFLCLPLSAALYAFLKDRHNIDSKIVTGNLYFEDKCIFKQDYKISEATDGVFREWAGHAWVEIEDLVCDLSFFRTLYSQNFTKPFKDKLVERFGVGRGAIIATRAQLKIDGLRYEAIDTLSDDIATGIIKGVPQLLKGS